MSSERDSGIRKSHRGAIIAVREQLNGVKVELTSFSSDRGANVYVLSDEKNGVRRHTFIDAGDMWHQNRILSVLAENNIDPGHIERIIITHGHPDHYGLAYLLSKDSRAKVAAHASLRGLIEGERSPVRRGGFDTLDPSRLRECNMEYLREPDKDKAVNIGGASFPRLTEPIEIGQGGRLEILGCPQSMVTHSPDQIIMLYSPRDDPHPHQQTNGDYRPTDDIIFSGDLWLMRGPMFHYAPSDATPGRDVARPDPRQQDAEAKGALKKGFCLIRVKPGHGEEFLGTRIIPFGLLAKRDLLVELDYPLDADESILRLANLAPKITARQEQAYASFVKELALWRQLGYTQLEISELLIRIYQEQKGGDPLAAKDRRERRQRLKATLARLKEDEPQPNWLRQLAQVTQSKLNSVL